jgi:serine/threonine-protein kinase
MGTDLDGRADIYATGCVAYWLLTGNGVHRRDHDGASPAARPDSASASIGPDRPADPQALDDLVLSCLAKDPAERPQSARELSLRLAEVEGANAWTQDRAREWWATHQPALP